MEYEEVASCLPMRNERGKEKKDKEEDFHEKNRECEN